MEQQVTVDGSVIAVETGKTDEGESFIKLRGVTCDLEGEAPGLYIVQPREKAAMRVLQERSDVDDQVEVGIADTLDWFDGRRLNTEEFIDRLCEFGNNASPPFDIESYGNPAVRKIMLRARLLREET